MPAKGSDDLFKLIKALTPAEKGYFKKFADRSVSEKDNNYLKLFELIDAQDVYDEKKLQKQSFVNQLPRQKNYLQGMILKSLQLYDADITMTLQLENSLQQMRALLRRGQYDLCRKLLVKAKADALRCEFFLEALKLVQFEDYLNKESGADRSYETEKLNYVERNKLMEQEKNSDDMLQLEQQVVMFTRSSYSKNATLKNKMLTETPPLRSLKARLTFYNALAIYYNFTRDYEQQYFYSKEFLKFKKEDFKIFKSFYALLPAYANLFFACFANKRYKECQALANEMLGGQIESVQQKEVRRELHAIVQTFLFIGTGRFEEGLTFVKASIESLQGNNKLLANRRMEAEIMMNSMLIYFGCRQYKNCLKYLETLLSSQTKEIAAFIHYQALLINILTHYELGNKETTEHLIVAARRALKNSEKLTPLEDIMLAFLKKYLSDESKKSLITDAIRDLKKVSDKENYHSHASLYFFCLAWLESKAKNKTLAETLMEKAKKEAVE